MSKPREWPNNARWARDEAAMLAFRGTGLLRKLLENYFDISDAARIALAAQAQDCLHRIDELMTQVGAERRGV